MSLVSLTVEVLGLPDNKPADSQDSFPLEVMVSDCDIQESIALELPVKDTFEGGYGISVADVRLDWEQT